MTLIDIHFVLSFWIIANISDLLVASWNISKAIEKTAIASKHSVHFAKFKVCANPGFTVL